MIIWFTGQTNSGKTTLAHMLSQKLSCPWLDGDAVRKLVCNHDYSTEGRRENIALIQEMAVVSSKHNKCCVVSAIAPFRDQRDAFKLKHLVLEIYLSSPAMGSGPKYHVPYYEPPLQNFLGVSTYLFTPKTCLAMIMETLTPLLNEISSRTDVGPHPSSPSQGLQVLRAGSEQS